jgi:putative peptidoglycan lipid II flippase
MTATAEAPPALPVVRGPVVAVAAAILVGTGLGFLRDVVIARNFGASAGTDAFFVAWLVPETASTLLLQGPLVFVLVPLFSRELAGCRSLGPLVERSLAVIVLLLAAVTAVIAAAAPAFVHLFAPRLDRPGVAIEMVRIVSPTVLLMGLAGYLTSALRSGGSFVVPALVFTAYNCGIIGTILLLDGPLGIVAAAVGVSIGAALMVLVQVPGFVRRVGLPRRPRLHGFVRPFLAAFAPIAVFATLRQGQVYVERFLASFLDPGSITQLNYAAKIGQVPVGIAITVAIVNFPALARWGALENADDLVREAVADVRVVVGLLAPAIVRLLFQRGAFGAADAHATSGALRIYAIGLAFQGVAYVAALPFFAAGRNLWALVPAALGCLVATGCVGAALLHPLDVRALAAGDAAGVALLAATLLALLYRKIGRWDVGAELVSALRAGVAAAAAGVAAFLVLAPMPGHAALDALGGAAVVVLVYGAAGSLLRVEAVELARRQLFALSRRLVALPVSHS